MKIVHQTLIWIFLYLLKIQCFIQNYPNVDGFFILGTLRLDRFQNTALYLKKYHKKSTTFGFSSTRLHKTFTKCVSYQSAHFDVLICQM